MVFVRKVKTASGATAVQIAERRNGRDKVLEHLGSAHTDAELAALMETARDGTIRVKASWSCCWLSHRSGRG